jgi:ssDNA-binding replication factor A large subunit
MQKIKSVGMPLSCRRNMTTQDLIQAILEKNRGMTPQELHEKFQAEKIRNGDLLGDETILRLIAARFGVSVPQNSIQTKTLSSSQLLAGLNDVTVEGRLIAVFPVKSFEGEKPGKFATLLIIDNGGVLRVMLWNERVDLVERGELRAGQTVRLLHCYTREDRCNQVELHLGGKSQIEVQPQEKANEYPGLDKFATKINSLNKTSGNVNLCCKVKQVLRSSTFTRSDATEGTVMHFVIADDSGEIAAVAWNEKVVELEKTLKANSRLQLVNARVKEGKNGSFEVHVDSNTFIEYVFTPETSISPRIVGQARLQ